jgi:two-component system CheB/CheR fusion protein
MPVTEVKKTVGLEPDHVYVISPRHKLEITDSRIGSRELDKPHGQRTAIDDFFRSLAASHGDGFAVILSGGGTDGVLGGTAVKQGGGLVLVQDPVEAAHSGMPEAVISAGVADVIGFVSELAAQLVDLTRHKQRMAPLLQPAWDDQHLNPEDAQVFEQILELLHSRTGHDFRQYKPNTIMRRMARRMQLQHTDTLAAYLSYLRQSAPEAQALINDLLIIVTSFFRDAESWDALTREVVERIVQRSQADGTIRIWVAGCATGEEAYSTAIVFREALERSKLARELLVFASDIDESSLATAREGLYPAAISTDVSQARLDRYFTRRGDHYRVIDSLRNCVVFAHHCLLRDPPFSGLHLVSCRNLLIYLERELQEQVQAVFRYATRNDGYLFLGSAESASAEWFEPLDKLHRIYRMGRRPAELRSLLLARYVGKQGESRSRAQSVHRAQAPLNLLKLHLSLLEEAAVPSILVDEGRRVLHLSESAGRYLQPHGGAFGSTVEELLREELREEARSALERAFADWQPVQTLAVAVQFNGTPRSVSMLVHPRRGPDVVYALLMFLEGGKADADGSKKAGAGGRVVLALREKLLHAEKRIAAAGTEHDANLQDLRAANEELQSLNEEYRSTAEELETSKEELQSVNEELQTLNTELRLKLEETSRAHNDLENLMAATQIATLFLDRQLRIKRFTPHVTELFNVSAKDEGRPIGDFTHKLEYPELQEHARRVLSELTPISQEVLTQAGETLMARVVPYRTADDRIDGVVITFVDISAAKRSEDQLRQTQARLESELRTTQRLHRMSMTVAIAKDQQQALDEILATAMELLAADFGTIQTRDEQGELEIVASHGIRHKLLPRMGRVHAAPGSVTMRALESGSLAHVRDVLADESYVPHRKFALELGYRSVISTPLTDGNENVIGFLAMMYRQPDHFTDRTRQVAELLAQQASLLLVSSSQNQRLADLYDELSKRTQIVEASEAKLKQQAEVLRQQDLAKEDFLAMLGHELRNPLAAIRNSLQALHRVIEPTAEVDESVGAQVARGLQIVDRQSRHMTRLINDLLDISRINQGKLHLSPEPMDLRVCIEDVAAALESAIEEADLRLVLDLPRTALRTVGDPERIVQVLDNLLRNAIQFTDSGGTLTISARRTGKRIRIAVCDTGIGMEPMQIESLFRPYRQATMKPSSGGLGLGLTLSRQLIQLHGGTLTAHSDGPDQGSEFVIELPAREAEETTEPESVETPPPRRRVLIVDDDRDNARSMSILLGSLGQKCAVALDGETALETAREFQPQVVFLDLSMPGMDGVEVARRLRSEKFAGEPPQLVALSGHARGKVPDPFDRYLMKPATMDDLLKILHYVRAKSTG